MKRGELAAVAAARLPADGFVFCGLGSTSRAWRALGDPRPTYYASDPMGGAPTLALGFALARPDLAVTLLEGDGDLLMDAGALVTIAAAGAVNFRMIVFHNRIYQTGGGQPLATGPGFDLAKMAQGAGLGGGRVVADTAAAAAAVGELVTLPGPSVLVAMIEDEPSPYTIPTRDTGPEERAAFRAAVERSRP